MRRKPPHYLEREEWEALAEKLAEKFRLALLAVFEIYPPAWMASGSAVECLTEEKAIAICKSMLSPGSVQEIFNPETE